MNFSRINRGVAHFGSDVRNAIIECRLTGFSIYLTLHNFVYKSVYTTNEGRKSASCLKQEIIGFLKYWILI
jgi:hypothetical protein